MKVVTKISLQIKENLDIIVYQGRKTPGMEQQTEKN